jgi:transcriptional regulator with XRE-family HTH domain
VDHSTGRPLLRELREDRGWTQQDVARQLVRLAWLRRQERVGVNADMVAKWERGAKGVSPRYRELLCLLFGVDAADLGLAARPLAKDRCSAHRGSDALIDTLGETAALLDQLGTAGAVLQPKMFEVWRDEIIRRRTLLKLMTLAPAAGLATTGAAQSRPGKPTIETARTLDELVGRYQGLYHSTAPAVLLTPVVAHLETIRDGLRHATAPCPATQAARQPRPRRYPRRPSVVLRPERLDGSPLVLQPGTRIRP